MGDNNQRGFAGMDEEKKREMASKGSHSHGKQNNPGNFANDPAKGKDVGRKGGEPSEGDR